MVNIILVLLLSAGLVSSHLNSEPVVNTVDDALANVSCIYVSDTFEDLVATDESEHKYGSITSNNATSLKVVRIHSSEQPAVLFSFSVSLAALAVAALFAATCSSQGSLNIISTIHKKDGKK